jgi:hypothetical protein
MNFGYCNSAKQNKTTVIIDILLLQALKARISEERQARDVEITSLRMQSKRDIAALEAKLAQSSSQYVMTYFKYNFSPVTLVFLQLGAAQKISARVDAGAAKRCSPGYNFCSHESAKGRACPHANETTAVAR